MLSLSVFTLRLAAGMVACLLLLKPAQINPRYYRTHFLTTLALAGVSRIFVPREFASWQLSLLLIAAMVIAFAASVVWSLENAPGGVVLVVVQLENASRNVRLERIVGVTQFGQRIGAHRVPSPSLGAR